MGLDSLRFDVLSRVLLQRRGDTLHVDLREVEVADQTEDMLKADLEALWVNLSVVWIRMIISLVPLGSLWSLLIVKATTS